MTELSPGQILWPLLSILSSGAVILSVVVAVIKLNRRTPPLPEEVAKIYATKGELHDQCSNLSGRIDREIGMILASDAAQNRKLNSIITTTSHTARETDRSLGRIEGKIEGIQGALDQHIKEHKA